MQIVIAGGSGFLGRALSASLLRAGHDVLVLTRTPRGTHDVIWTPDDTPAAWMDAVDGTDVVVNLAGESLDRRWTPDRKRAMRATRLNATRALVAAIRRVARRPPVFLSASAIGVYGVRGSEPLTERASVGSDFLAQLCRAWEDAALEAAALTRVVQLRTGLVLGRDGGALPRMARPFQFMAGGRLGSGRQFYSWIHLEDWVRLVEWAMARSEIRGPLNATAPAPVTNAEFARALGRALHRPAWVPAPAFALRAILGEMADAMVLGGQRVIPERALEAGFSFVHPTIDEALAALYLA